MTRLTLGPERRVVEGRTMTWRQVLIGADGAPIGYLVKQSAPKACEDRRRQIVPVGELWSRTLGGEGSPVWYTWREALAALREQLARINPHRS